MKITAKKLSIILIIMLAVSIIPLLVLSFYNVPQQDDYYYGIKTFHAYNETGSIIETIKAAAAQVAETYENWQGSWSAVFLFALHPGIWGAQNYFISTFILLAVFIGAAVLFSYAVLGKVFHMPKYRRIILTAIILFAQIQFVPTAVQAFFWWNGSVYYTFFYSLSMALFSFIAVYMTSKSKAVRIFSAIAACITAAVISGGNYVTALITVLILCSLAVYIYRCNFPRRKLIVIGIITALFAAGFIISITAPGNGVRAERYQLPFNRIITTIGGSFVCCMHRIYTSANLPFIFIMLLLTPFIISAAEKSTLRFKHPWIFTLFIVFLFMSQFAPPSYGMGGMADEASGRIVNIIYYSMYWFMAAEIYYIGGYITHKYGISMSGIILKIKEPRIYKQTAAVSFIIIVVMPILVLDNNWYYGGKFTATNAAYSLVMREAEEFADEWHERIDMLMDPNEKRVVFKPLKVHPKLLFYSDMEADSDYEWSNLPMRRYYDKDYLSVQYE